MKLNFKILLPHLIMRHECFFIKTYKNYTIRKIFRFRALLREYLNELCSELTHKFTLIKVLLIYLR